MASNLTGSSFRDPNSRLVSEKAGFVVREFTNSGAEEFAAVTKTGLFEELIGAGHLVSHRIVGQDPLRIESPRFPIVTYPSEWTGSMLREAAQTTLRIAVAAWRRGAELKDASAYNLVFHHAKPVWVDLGSFQRGRRGVWGAYGQFCDHFLSPLLIEQRTRVPYRKIWSQAGVPVALAAAMLPLNRHLDLTILKHVYLRARLERSSEGLDESARLALRRDISLPEAAMPRLLAALQKSVDRLGRIERSHWSQYELNNTYDIPGQERRDEFLLQTIGRLRERGRAIDVGCNTGRHSAILAEHFEHVVAIDSDPASLEAVRQRQGDGNYRFNIWPAVVNILDPTSPTGLFHEERKSFHERFDESDLVLWMAVLHHLVVTGDLPLPMFADLMARMGNDHVVELVDPDDQMVRVLTASKGGVRHEYSRQAFENAIAERFRIIDIAQVTRTRWLYHLSKQPNGRKAVS